MNRNWKDIFKLIFIVVSIVSCNTLAADIFLTSEANNFIRENFDPAPESEQKNLQQSLVGSWVNSINTDFTFIDSQYIFSGVSGWNDSYGASTKRTREILVFPPGFPTPARYQLVVSAALPADEQTLTLLDELLEKLKAKYEPIVKRKIEMREALHKMPIEEQKRNNLGVIALQEKSKLYSEDMGKLRTIRTAIQESINDGESKLYLGNLNMKFFFDPKPRRGTREILMIDELKENQKFEIAFLMNLNRFYVASTYIDKNGKYQPIKNLRTSLNAGIAASVEREYKTALTIWESKCKLLQENEVKLRGTAVLQECKNIVEVLSNQTKKPQSTSSTAQSTNKTSMQPNASVKSMKNPPQEISLEKPTIEKPFKLSGYAHFQVIPVDPNAAIAPEIKAMWAKGFYIHLKPDGNFGFNTDVPGPYLYLPVNRWKNENGVLTLTLDKIVYTFTLPMKESTGETTLNTVDSTLSAFEMTYVTKEKGVR